MKDTTTPSTASRAGPSASPAVCDRAAMAASANPQAPSPLFALLPLEVRKMIYVEFWRLDGEGAPSGGPRQHIFRLPHGRGGMGHFPCLLGGERAAAAQESRDSTAGFHTSSRGVTASEALAWERGAMTDWGLHWPCQDHLKKRTAVDPADPCGAEQEGEGSEGGEPSRPCPVSDWSPFLPVMLTCKQLYLECSESIYDTVTFYLTDTAQAAEFLGSRLPSLPCRSVEISLRVTPLLTELYYGPDGGEPAVVTGKPPVTADNNPWQRLCDVLIRTSRKDGDGGGGLRNVHIWLDSSDLRPWHRRVVETRFFARLMAVEKPVGEFVVDVPELPEEAEKRGLPGCYLEDVPPADLPFEVRRSKRANNWLMHINRISHMRFAGPPAQ